MPNEPERPEMTTLEIEATIAYLNHELRGFEKGLNKTQEMLKVKPMEQLYNQLTYYRHACGTVRKLLSDLLRYKASDESVTHASI